MTEMVAAGQQSTESMFSTLLERAAFAALLVLAAIFPFELRQPLIDFGWFVLTDVEIVLYSAIILWSISHIAGRRLPSVPRRLWLPVVAWLGVLAISALLATAFRGLALHFVGRTASGVLVGWMAYDLAHTPHRWQALIVAMAVAGTLVAVFGLFEASAVPALSGWLGAFKASPTRVGDVLRVSSTLSYATIASMVLEMTIPLMLALALVVQQRTLRVLAWAGITVSLAALTLTLSRAGMISLVVALGLMIGVAMWKRQRWAVVAGAAAAGVLVVFVGLALLSNPTVGLRLSTETERDWYQAGYVAPASVQALPGQRVSIPVQVTNNGVRTWTSGGEHPFALSYHLYGSTDEPVTYDGARSALPDDLAPGDTTVIQAQVEIPPEPGEYRVEWDMVQEAVTWFSWKDAPTASTRVLALGQPVESAEMNVSVAPIDVRIINPTPGRLKLWRAALRMAADRPLLGVGPDNFRLLYGSYAGVDDWDTGIHANNLYIEWLADTGVIGLLAFLWMSVTMGREVVRRVTRGPTEASWLLTLGLAAGLLAWYVHGVLDYFYEFTPTFVAFWLIAGLASRTPSPERRMGGDRKLTQGGENGLLAFHLGPVAFGLLSQHSARVAQHYFEGDNDADRI